MNKLPHDKMEVSKENSRIESLQFLSGGGQMGEVIRSFDWSKTPVGSYDTWPQSLRIAVGIMLDSPFAMYIAWGKEYIQLYNDGYRSIFSATKHPRALGLSIRKTFAEIWSTIGPMFDAVMQGTPVDCAGNVLELNRNGYLEECVFDFSYSPILLENGEVGGVQVTLIETIEEENNLEKLNESNNQLNFAIEAAELGTWDYDPHTNKFTGNNRIKDWFGLPHNAELLLSLAIDIMFEKDRSRVTEAIQTALQYKSGGLYDIEYGIINPVTKQERIVNAKGRAWFGDDKIAYRFNGILLDITKETTARKKNEESEKRLANERKALYNSFMNAPAGIAILKGDSLNYEFANIEYEKLVGKKITLNKTVLEHFPDIEQQGYIELFQNVFVTGEPFIANELPVELNTKGDATLEKLFLNLVAQPLKDEEGKTDRLMVHVIDVTAQVITRKEIEASEKRFSNILSQSLMAIAIFTGPEMVVTFANEPMIAVLGKGNAVLNKPLTEGVPELKSQIFPQLLDDVYTTGIPFEAFETKVILVRNGITVNAYFNFLYQPYRDIDDTITGITVLATEVTEQVLAKQQIEISEAFNRTILESSPDCLKVLDSEGYLQYMNLNGLRQMEIDDFLAFKNKKPWSFWGSENEGLVKASVEKALKGEMVHFTAFCYTAKGAPKWWDVVISPVSKPGEPVQQIMSVSRDITEKKEAEEKIKADRELLETTFKHIASGIYLFDKTGNILYLNEKGANYLGYETVKEVLAEKDMYQLRKKVVENFSILDEQGNATDVLETSTALTIKTGKTTEVVFQFIHRKFRVSHWFVAKTSPLFDNKGLLISVLTTFSDITLQKTSEDDIRKLAMHLKLSTDSANVGTWSLNLPTQKLEWSALHKKMWGYDEYQKGLVYEDWHKVILHEDKEKAFKNIEESRINNSIYEVEYRIERANDQVIRWMKSSGQYHYNEAGEAVTLTGISLDITEQKNAEADLQKSKERLQGGLNVANVALAEINYITGLVTLSAEAASMYGLSADKLTVTNKELHDTFHPDYKEKIEKLIEEVMQPESNGLMQAEHSIIYPDGEIRWLKINKQIFFDRSVHPAKPLYSILASQDITQKKEAEEKIAASEKQFRVFADSIQNLAWIANADGWIYFYNQQWYDYTGTTLEEMQGWGWEKVHHPHHKKKIKTFIEAAWKKDEAFELTFPLRRHDGEYRWFLTRAYPVKDAGGNIERWIGTNTDITEQKSFTEELEKKVNERTEELQAANLALESSNAELKSFSFIASHDLQEPLRKIQTFSNRIIETEKFSDQTQDYFDRIVKASQRMRNLIESLLDFSRTDTTDLIFVPCNLNTVVEEAKNDLQISILEKNVIIEFENLPTIMGLHVQLLQLFTNLIENAIKYSMETVRPHIKITSSIIEGIKIEHLSANKLKEYYIIKIEDNGIGFEKEYATKIFELFQRLHGRHEYSGTGIGLAIVKKIITNHYGFITAKGIPNTGSTFTLYIPTND